MSKKPTYEELELRIKTLEQQAVCGINNIDVSGISIEWDVEQGKCTFENLPVAMMWIDSTLAGLMSGVQAMVGTERFGLALQSEGRKSVVQDWQVISQFSEFKDGFKAIANIAAVAGWGDWTLIYLNENKKECQFKIKGSWEGLYQKSLGVCWGSGMLAGKMAGYCSKLFNTNCWAEQTSFIARGEEFDEFLVKPSKRSIEKEIDNILATDEATRADMAVALQKLQKEISERIQIEEALRESEEKYRLLVESTPNWIWMCDLKSRFTFSNNSVKEILGYENHEILDTSALDLIQKEDQKSVQKWFQKAKKQKRGWRDSVIRWQHKNKSIRFLETIAEPILDDKGDLIGYLGIDRDVTDRRLSEIALQKAHNELQEKTKRLEIQKNSLEELNTAMKVLLKKREEDKIEIESNVLTNVKELIEPYIEKIKKTKMDDQQRALLSIVESNINEIVSPFTRKMSLKYLNLTPTEIQIANLIRHGSSTKDIAGIMRVSPKTVETHRRNIRRKIGLEGKRANLRSHLLSLH